VTNINGYDFVGWGAHTTDYPHSYLTAACAVGVTEDDVVSFLERFSKVWKKVASRQSAVASSEAGRDVDNGGGPDITSHTEDEASGN
jgi:O-phospho-L-seryl-tRNASec:L-selenocysteinyl-tRNA synthase